MNIFLGRMHTVLHACHVSALLAYIAICPTVRGTLFVLKDRSVLSREKLVTAIGSALQSAGVDARNYTGTVSVSVLPLQLKSCLEDSVVKMMGRWESTAYQQYIQTPTETVASLSAHLVQDQ